MRTRHLALVLALVGAVALVMSVVSFTRSRISSPQLLQRTEELADIFALNRPVKNFLSAEVVSPAIATDWKYDSGYLKSEKIQKEKALLQKRKDDLIKRLKGQRDSLEEKVMKHAIAFHQQQLDRALKKALVLQQHYADLAAESARKKVLASPNSTILFTLFGWC